MTIGEKIKVLRREQDVTQEKLADYLNISCQAVSKWENGSALPDISLVVPLANFFGVSADVLFGLDAQARSEEIMTFNEEGRRLANLGLVQEQISHWRKAVLKYPKNHHFQIMLAYALLNVCFSEDTGENGQTKEWMAEAVSICERVLSDSTDTDNRSSAAQILVLIYGSESGPMHDEEKAVEYASKAASIFVSRQILLEAAYSGEKKAIQRQTNTLLFIDSLCGNLTPGMDGTPEEHIFAYETALKIYEAVFYDGNFLFYHCRVAGIHKGLARCYARLQDKDRTLAHLKLAKAHANAYDGMPECEHHYSGLFLSKAVFNTKTISKNFAENETGLLKNALQEKIYDFLRADPEFTCFAQSLGL